MLLSELMGLPVSFGDDEPLGTVVDVRFRRGPRHGGHEGELELVALIVSPHSRLALYGYERGTVRGPAVVAGIIRYLHRGARVVPWECVSRVEADRVVLGVDPPRILLDTRLGIEV